MAKKGENIYKRKDGRWEGRYIRYHEFTGKPKWGYVYACTYAETKRKLFEARKNAAMQNPSPEKSKSFESISRLWLDSIKLKVKETTYAKYLDMVEKHIIPELGSCLIHKINTEYLESYAEKKLQSGRLDQTGGLSSKTVQDLLSVICSIFKYANRIGICTTPVTDGVRIKREHKEVCVMTEEEQRRLTAFLLKNINADRLGILLSLYTGLRVGELCALKWENISCSEKILYVKSTMQRIRDVSDAPQKTKIVITSPKTKNSIRKIPIPDALLSQILSMKKNTNVCENAYVLTNREDIYIEPRTIQNRFKKYLQASGLPPYHFHVLRHTFATRCMEIGFEIKSLSEILGHATVQITLVRYVHSSFQLKINNMNLLSAFLTK